MSSEYVFMAKQSYEQLGEAAKALQQAVWNTEQQIVKLEIENKNLRAALRQARWIALASGVTMREFSKNLGITASQLSAWTDEVPNREPDFKD